MGVKKIISGGQTGADRGGLEAGKYLGLETGGWMPRGFMTEDGPRPELAVMYGVLEHESDQYPPRTRENVISSDGTVWFGTTNSRGYHCTKRASDAAGRPMVINPTAERLREFVTKNDIWVLNVAGNRASVDPDVHDRARRIIEEALR